MREDALSASSTSRELHFRKVQSADSQKIEPMLYIIMYAQTEHTMECTKTHCSNGCVLSKLLHFCYCVHAIFVWYVIIQNPKGI